MDEIDGGIRRVTLPLPTRPGHVHAYALPGSDGWTVVDTGLGLPDAKERWARELEELPGPVRRIVVTHFHPDHVGAAADLVELTGAPVAQGRLDYDQCRLVWGGEDWADVLVDWFASNGVPDDVVRELIGQGLRVSAVRPLPARPRAPRSGRRRRRVAGRGRAGPRRRPADAARRRRARRCRSHPRSDLADGRAVAAEPTRPARRLPRALEAAAALEARSRCRATASRSSTRPGAHGRSSRTTPSDSTRPPRRSVPSR